uniref:Serine/threonine-protein kinase sik2 n=1 Tax=Sphaerodactylus townsendi TaxID=933632 RepID=A0ACB8EZ51_9SAUR
MLVLDPSKRLTIAQIKEHKWMLIEVPVQRPALYPQGQENEPSIGEYNEQVLRLMHSLGIDQQKTIELGPKTEMQSIHRSVATVCTLCMVVLWRAMKDMAALTYIAFVSLQSLQNKSYNHFAAIYYLLIERLKSHRSSFPVDQRLDSRQRRPSTIAEQTVAKAQAAAAPVNLRPQNVRLLRSPGLPATSAAEAFSFPPSGCQAESAFMEEERIDTPKVHTGTYPKAGSNTHTKRA